MSTPARKWGLLVVIVFALAAMGFLVFRGDEVARDVDAFSDGITGNQAIREGGHLKRQVRTLGRDHNEALDDAMGR